MNFDEKLTEQIENGVEGSIELSDGVKFQWQTCDFSDDVEFYIGKAKIGYIGVGELPDPEDGLNGVVEVLVQSLDSPLLMEPNEMYLNVCTEDYIENPIEATAKAFMEAVAWDWLSFARSMVRGY